MRLCQKILILLYHIFEKIARPIAKKVEKYNKTKKGYRNVPIFIVK